MERCYWLWDEDEVEENEFAPSVVGMSGCGSWKPLIYVEVRLSEKGSSLANTKSKALEKSMTYDVAVPGVRVCTSLA